MKSTKVNIKTVLPLNGIFFQDNSITSTSIDISVPIRAISTGYNPVASNLLVGLVHT